MRSILYCAVLYCHSLYCMSYIYIYISVLTADFRLMRFQLTDALSSKDFLIKGDTCVHIYIYIYMSFR